MNINAKTGLQGLKSIISNFNEDIRSIKDQVDVIKGTSKGLIKRSNGRSDQSFS